MIKNIFGDLYVGISENPQHRTNYHNNKQGAQFTKNRKKFKLVFEEKWTTLHEARKREIQIKKWRQNKKEILIERFRNGLPTKQ